MSLLPGEAGRARPLRCYNTSSSDTIPAFGLARVTGVSEGVLQLAQPDADGQDVVVAVGQIPPESYGNCTLDFPYWAHYDTADGTPLAGETWGAAAGSHKLRLGRDGFTVLGGAGSERVMVHRPPAGPAFSGARVLRTGDLVGVVSGSYVSWQSNSGDGYDEGGYWDSGSPTLLTVPATGHYLVTANVGLVLDVTGTSVSAQAVLQWGAGSTYLAASLVRGSVSGQGLRLSVTATYRATAGAGGYFRCLVYHGGGSGTTLEAVYTNMSVTRLR